MEGDHIRTAENHFEASLNLLQDNRKRWREAQFGYNYLLGRYDRKKGRADEAQDRLNKALKYAEFAQERALVQREFDLLNRVSKP